ncbi:intracellular growth attenuator family protein, partial [Salmonella enterica subsp. enterica serovar Kentucky]|nr:intracellular growth attenuator family protein [Salmonella enterica subsp. enterica serovar Kentucky]
LVERNEAPLGIVYGSDAVASKGVNVVATFPEDSHKKVEYPIANDEVKNFPLQHWLRSTVIAIGSLLVLFMLLFWIPLDMPIKFTL